MLRCTGFTLLELLLTVSLIVLLIGLLLPSLNRVRQAGLDAKSLANVRTHVLSMTMYASDSNGSYLDFISPSADYGVIRWGQYVQKIVYFQQPNYWHFAMAKKYYGGQIASNTFCVPGSPPGACTTPDHLGMAGYWYSASFLAVPEYWNRRTREGRFQWRGMRADQVLFPSAKGLFIGGWPMLYADAAPDWRIGSDVGFVDGHSDRVTPSELLPLESGGDGQYYEMSIPVLHTKDGVRGRDVR